MIRCERDIKIIRKRIIMPRNYYALMFLSILCLFAVNVSVAGPKLHCGAPKYDFGTVIGRDSIAHEFILTNRGDEPVVISSIKNCCGVKSTLVPMTIPPGSNAVCRSVFTTKSRWGKQDKQILLATNMRRKPYFELKITGTLLKPIEIEPRYVRLKDVFPESAITQTITATNLLDQSVTLESVESSVPGIAVEVCLTAKERKDRKSEFSEETGITRLGQGSGEQENAIGTTEYTEHTESGTYGDSEKKNWVVLLRRTGVLPVGRLNGQITLNFSTGAVRVPVMGTVEPAIQVVPAQIKLSAKFTKPVERFVMLRGETPFEVTSAKLENAENVSVEKLAPTRWRVKLVVSAEAIHSNAQLEIKTTLSAQPRIEVGVSGK